MRNLFNRMRTVAVKVTSVETFAQEVARLAALRQKVVQAMETYESTTAAAISALSTEIAKVKALREKL